MGSASSCRTDSQDTKKKQRLSRRDPEEQVSRLIEERLPGISQVQLTQHEVRGRTLLSRITADHAEISSRGGRLSGVYWTKLRAEYGVECGPPLKVINPNQPVSPALCNALAVAKHNNAALRSKRELSAFFGTCTSLNQKEMVGIVKFFSELKVAGNESSAMALSAAMKTFVKINAQETYPEENTNIYLFIYFIQSHCLHVYNMVSCRIWQYICVYLFVVMPTF